VSVVGCKYFQLLVDAIGNNIIEFAAVEKKENFELWLLFGSRK